MMPALASKVQEIGQVSKSVDTNASALHVTLGSLLHLSADLLVGGLLLQLNSEIHNGHINGWHTQGHASQLALHLRDHLGHGLGSTSGGWDDVSRACTATTPVLLGGAIHSGLRCSHGMAGGHETTLDAPLLLQDTHGRGSFTPITMV
eukprot:Skav216463  [mRNA]  locus=scaffold50:810826:817447:+ [translate_table: standard]